MNWLTGGKQGEAKRLISKLANVTQRDHAAQDLFRLGADAVPSLIEPLSHPEMWIRVHAVNALGSVKNPRVASALLEMLNDPEREVQKQVILTLGELKDARTLPALQEIASQRADRELHTLAKDTINKIS